MTWSRTVAGEPLEERVQVGGLCVDIGAESERGIRGRHGGDGPHSRSVEERRPGEVGPGAVASKPSGGEGANQVLGILEARGVVVDDLDCGFDQSAKRRVEVLRKQTSGGVDQR